jgi:carbon monoxide dehydrogenase subunit G
MVLIEENQRPEAKAGHSGALREPIVLRLKGVTHVDRDADWVFGRLHDPETLLSCVPGARLTRLIGPGSFEARIAVGFGPFRFAYGGTGRIVDSDPRSHTASMTLTGRADSHVPPVRIDMSMAVVGQRRSSEIQMAFRIVISDRTGLLSRGWIDPIACDLLDRTIRQVKERLEHVPFAPSPTAT